MKTLFDADRHSLEDALALTEASLHAHATEHPDWAVAFSGGKDSTATLTAVLYLIESGRVPRPRSLTVLYADTRLELPNLQAAAFAMLAEVRRRGWRTEVVLPLLDKRWFVMMLGRGIPPSHSGFRWCTGALKVDPMAAAMEAIRDTVGSKLLLITGMRIGESAARDNRIALACGRNGGECGHGWYHETTPAEVAHTFAPLLHWRTCHVWDWLRDGLAPAEKNPHREGTLRWAHWYRQRRGRLPCHGFDCRLVIDVYDADHDGSETEALSRTGCLVCPVASRDYALERTVAKPEWAYLQPLTRLRGLYDWLTHPHQRLMKNGERRADGSLSSRPMRTGPLILSARREALQQILAIQREVNDAAAAQGRPRVTLIDCVEHGRILELIDQNTWPDKWDGTEPTGKDDVPTIYRDGTTQLQLFGE